MRVVQIIDLMGYSFGGIIAAQRGDYVVAAKCFILAATALVDPETAGAMLTQAGIDRANMAADVDEVVRFGALS